MAISGLEILSLEADFLNEYRLRLKMGQPAPAMGSLASAIASSRFWEQAPHSALIVRPIPHPVLGVVGRIDNSQKAGILAQLAGLRRVCSHIVYVDYAKAEKDCERLASRIVERLGSDDLRECCFTAVPRGGVIVLGMLAYALGLAQEQLEPPFPPEKKLVVVDDCALTGARFRRFLRKNEGRQVYFAPLYSPPDLRAAIEAEEARVIACISAHDLHDDAPENLGDEYSNWKGKILAQKGEQYYWVGQTEHICFAWNEPDRVVRHPVTGEFLAGWHVIPPELCLKNRTSFRSSPVSVQVQPEAKGPLRPAEHVLFGELDGQVLAKHLLTGETYGFKDTAADMWRAIVEYGNLEDVQKCLLSNYDVDAAQLQADLHGFVERLVAMDLLCYDA